MSCRVDFEEFKAKVGEEPVRFELDQKKQDLFDKQIPNGAPRVQKELADTLIREHSKYKAIVGNYYVDAAGKEYLRTTNFIKKLRDGYFAFQSNDESRYEINRELGNTTDIVLEGAILGKSLPDIYQDVKRLRNGISISEKAVNELVTEINKYKVIYPGAVFLPQITLGTGFGVAGTLDLLIIESDGTMHIIDLKTSVNPVTKVRQTYDRVFVKDGVRRSSKKQLHATQLTIYKHAVEQVTGKPVKTIGIMGSQITQLGENNRINELKMETLYLHEEDKTLMDMMKKHSTKEEVASNLMEFGNTEFLQEVIEVLEKEIDVLKKQKKYDSVGKINKLIEYIQTGNDFSQIAEFIEYMHQEFVTDKNSLAKRFQAFVDRIDTDKDISTADILQQLDLFKSEQDLFRGIVEELQNLYENSKDIPREDNSVLDMLDKIISEFNRVERISKNRVNPILAELLSEQLPNQDKKSNLAEEIAIIKKKLTNEKLSDRRRRGLENRLARIEDKYYESKESILRMLNTGDYKDISIMSAHLNPAVSVNNSIIATFALHMKEAFDKVREHLFGVEKIAAKAFDEYAKKAGVSRDNVKEFNKPFYEVIQEGDKQYYSFVQKLDYNAYSKAMKDLAVEAEIEAKILKTTNPIYAEANEITLKYQLLQKMAVEKGYRVSREAEDITIDNPYKPGEKAVLIEGYHAKIREAKASTTSYEEWFDKNFVVTPEGTKAVGKEVTMPNWDMFRNEKWNAVMDGGAKEKYYKFLLSTYLSGQQMIQDTPMMYRLPGIEKIANDRVREGDTKGWLRRTWEGATRFLPNEQEEYGEDRKIIPHLYKLDLGMENTSLDLMGSVLTYYAAANKHAAQVQLEPVAKALSKTVSEKGPLHSAEDKLKDTKIGNKFLGEYFRKHKGNNTAAMLEALIDMHIYGKTRLKSNAGGVNWNKITDALMGFASFTQIGGNPVLAVANSMAAHISTAIDAWSGEHFSTKTWFWAKAEYRKNEPGFMSDMLGTAKKSKIGQLAELYDALQGEFIDEYGRKMSQGKVKKMWGSKGWFSFMHKGEHAAQVKVMMSILKDTKVKTAGGKTISLYDAYSVDKDGNLAVQPGVEFLNHEAERKIHALNKRFNGVYNSFDRPLIERHNAGRLLMMYRKFIAPNVRRRFQGWGYDYELGAEYEGYYRTFFGKLISERDELWNLLTNQSHNLTKQEVANVKRTAAEITYMLLLSSIAALLAAGLKDADDDDERGIGMTLGMKYALYWSMRAQSELSFYNFGLGSINTWGFPLNPGGTLKSFRTPSPIWSVGEKLFRTTGLIGPTLFGQNTAYYQRNENYKTIFGNLAEKGDPKINVAFMKLLGLNGYMLNPENGIKILEIYD